MNGLFFKSLILIAACTTAFGELDQKTIDRMGASGQKAYEDHQHLVNEVMAAYPCETAIQVNAQYERLNRVYFSTHTMVVEGEASIDVPLDVARHTPLFRSFAFEGEGLLGITRVDLVSDTDGFREIILGRHTDKGAIFGAILASFKPGTQYRIVFKGTGTINKVSLVNWEGIATEFNPSLYIAPGLDKPILDVEINVDATRYRSIGGICELQRDRYFRYYASPNMDRAGKEPYYKGKGFLPGRQIEKLAFLLEDRYGAADRLPSLKEDPKRPGYADPAFFEENKGFFWRFEGVDPDLTFSMCFDNWPSFMEPEVEHISNSTGTPKDYAAAADLAVQYLKAQLRDSGRTANWWEVKNESDIQSEWMWHGQKDYDSWGLLADFHNTMAERIHAKLPGIKVGGPASAWFQPHKGQFGVWKNHKRFMELTKGKLDFYSHHFYELASNNSYMEQWNSRDSYAQGIMECTLDMVKAQMTAMDHQVPILITEYGTLNAPLGDLGFWVHVKNVDNLLLNLLDRPQDIDMSVPFILTYMHWDPHAMESFIHQNDDGEFYKTKNTYLLDLWEDYTGKRLASANNHRKIFSHAVIDGDTLKIAINNRSDRRAKVNLTAALPEGVEVVSATRKMPLFEKGEMKFIQEPVMDLSAIDLGVEVTQLIYIKLSQAPALTTTLNETVWYAPDTAVKANDPVKMSISIPDTELNKERVAARLRIGIHRPGGFEMGATVLLNDAPIGTLDLSYSEGAQNYFDYSELDFDPALLKPDNDIKITFIEQNAHVSHAKIILTTE